MNIYFSFLPGSSFALTTSTSFFRDSLYAGEHSQDLYDDSNSEQKRMLPS